MEITAAQSPGRVQTDCKNKSAEFTVFKSNPQIFYPLLE